MFADNHQDRRVHTRLEPKYMDAVFTATHSPGVRGSILDVSESGMAIELLNMGDPPQEGTSIKLEIGPGDSNRISDAIGMATVKRRWNGMHTEMHDKGFSVLLENNLTRKMMENFWLHGRKQEERLLSQEKLALNDTTYLGNYRLSLVDCQVKLFTLTLTVGLGLAGAYFGLTYHNIIAGKIANPDLAFWRTMVAALPGIFAIACAFMVAQKSVTIQCIDAYLATIKECAINDQYPREYRGWESDLKRFRHVLATKKCIQCKRVKKCYEMDANFKAELQARSMYKNPKINLFHIIINLTFLSLTALSLIAVIFNIIEF